MVQLTGGLEHSATQLVLSREKAALDQDHHDCQSYINMDTVSETGFGYSSFRSSRGFTEAKHAQLQFRVKCPIMSRILSTAMAVIDRTSKTSIRYRADSDLTSYDSCFDDESENENGSSFFNYLEKNFSKPRVRQEYAICWPQLMNKSSTCLKNPCTADDEYFHFTEKHRDFGEIKLCKSRSYSKARQVIEDELLSESCDSKYDDEYSLFSDSDEKGSDSLDSCYITKLAQPTRREVPGWPLCQIPLAKKPENRDVFRDQSLELQLVPVTEPLSWRLFGLDELKSATASFSEDNLIGRGGCSKVYKGNLSDGKVVAVKVLKQNKDVSKDFHSEIDILSSLTYKNITALLGACFEREQHIFVYDFMSEGSLDEHLHGNGTKSVLTWASRYNVAVVIAGTLNYLHNECPRPVIHRDVKSSNILLSSEFQPQLSDFGLAIWGPSKCTEHEPAFDRHLVGTFGYIAPEYFMHGKVSDKVDVYSFGVVLLELVTGKKPILDPVGLQGQQSLVKWAKQMESGDIRALADPKLGDNFDEDQMRRLVTVAASCTCQSARARPTMTEVLRMLKGETSSLELALVTQSHHSRTWSEDDDFWTASELDRSCLALALMDMEEESTSIVITRKLKRRNTMADYLQISQ